MFRNIIASIIDQNIYFWLFVNNAFNFWLTMTMFGLSIIPLVNLLAQPWKTVESAFKYILAEVMLLWALGFIATAVVAA